MRSLGGIDVPLTEQKRLLTALGFDVTETKGDCPHRFPLAARFHGEADLVEEVCRIVGLDKVPLAEMPRLTAVARRCSTPRRSGW